MRRNDAYVLDMLLAYRDAMAFAAGSTFPQFERSCLHQNAFPKVIEVVGEAAARASAGTREAHPQFPWVRIVAMRDRLVQANFEVDLGLVWRTGA